MNISVVGTGYVGLVTGCCLAESGNIVTCIDNDAHKIDELVAGNVPIYEPGIEELLLKNQKEKRLSFTTDLADGIKNADVIFLALPTPPNDDGSADLSIILSVASDLGQYLPNRFCLIVNKSTVPVGSAKKVSDAITGSNNKEFEVVSNPEFLREGHAVEDFMKPERVVVGVSSKKAENIMRALYEPFISNDRPLYVTDPITSELSKYAANSFLVTKVNFMNEIAQLCELMGADVDMLRQAVGSDSRIGHQFLHPGIGCGGSCFPKDIRALEYMSEDHGYDFKLLKAAVVVNQQQQHLLVSKIMNHFSDNIKDKTFALWGLSFKPNTDDIREAPALVIINELIASGAKIQAYDPEANANIKKLYKDSPSLQIMEDKYAALDNAEALILATEWQEFIDSDIKVIKDKLNNALVFDGRNIFTPKNMEESGFSYYSIGRRPTINP